MHVLVVNIGSTSFKFRLFDMTTETVVARGGVEGVGKTDARVFWSIGTKAAHETRRAVADQAEAVRLCTDALLRPEDGSTPLRIDAVGFKAVHGGPAAEGLVTDGLLSVMAEYADIVPAHNPPYMAAMRAFGAMLPDTPRVAAFETGFHRSVAEARRVYAVPYAWKQEHGVQRYGFHGASHRYVAQHTARALGREDLRVISCHLGGSSSISALKSGVSLANSFGMTPQSGVPHNNRVGDIDAYVLPFLQERTGRTVAELLENMAAEGGLLGVSGLSNDMRALLTAAADGHERAALAVDMFVESVRDYIGAYLVLLGGVDVLVFTGGIGERSPEIRTRVCNGLEFIGIHLDEGKNSAPPDDGVVSTKESTRNHHGVRNKRRTGGGAAYHGGAVRIGAAAEQELRQWQNQHWV